MVSIGILEKRTGTTIYQNAVKVPFTTKATGKVGNVQFCYKSNGKEVASKTYGNVNPDI